MAHEHEDLVVGRDESDRVEGEGDRSETASQDDAALLVSSEMPEVLFASEA